MINNRINVWRHLIDTIDGQIVDEILGNDDHDIVARWDALLDQATLQLNEWENKLAYQKQLFANLAA